MLVITFGYILLGLFIWAIEYARIRRYGPDLFTVFPGIILTAAMDLSRGGFDTGVPFINRVLNDVGLYEALLVLVLLCLFVFSLYFTWFWVHSQVNLQRNCVPKIRIYVSRWRWFLVMLIGLTGMWVLLKELGSYNNLVLFRIDSSHLNRNFVTANLFSLTTTFMTLAVVGLMMFWGKKISTNFLFSLTSASVFALMTVSRRAFGIIILLVLFTFILAKKRFYITKIIVPTALIYVPIIIFGKKVLWLLSQNADVGISTIIAVHGGLFSGLLLFVANIGTPTIESWAALLYLDIPMRFGVDHLLSIARRIPDGILGLDLGFPERIVRISTEAFVGPGRQDIPPGLVGQMWLDYGFLGPIFWGIAFGLVISFLQVLYNRTEKDLAVVSLFAIAVYTAGLPINSGTFDFVFSVNVIFLVIFIFFIIKIKRINQRRVTVENNPRNHRP
jgi:hypothetical protein